MKDLDAYLNEVIDNIRQDREVTKELFRRYYAVYVARST